MSAEYREVGGWLYAGVPLTEWLDLWADVAEHNRRVYQGAAAKVQTPPDAPERASRPRRRAQ